MLMSVCSTRPAQAETPFRSGRRAALRDDQLVSTSSKRRSTTLRRRFQRHPAGSRLPSHDRPARSWWWGAKAGERACSRDYQNLDLATGCRFTVPSMAPSRAQIETKKFFALSAWHLPRRKCREKHGARALRRAVVRSRTRSRKVCANNPRKCPG